MTATLDQRLLAAHHAGDKPALVGLYSEAAKTTGSEPAAGFFLTQAYIFALDVGDPRAKDLHRRLVSVGREE